MTIRWLTMILAVASVGSSYAGGDSRVEAAVQDLASRINVPVAQINLVSQAEVTWPDRSLGCPRKGMMYAQVRTNGSELILESAGKRFAYHSGVGAAYAYCAVPAKKSGTPLGTPLSE
jgi:hypothetical protein